MKRNHLQETYIKAERHFYKGNYWRARKLFRKIVEDVFVYEGDSVAILSLSSSADSYLDKIDLKGNLFTRIF